MTTPSLSSLLLGGATAHHGARGAHGKHAKQAPGFDAALETAQGDHATPGQVGHSAGATAPGHGVGLKKARHATGTVGEGLLDGSDDAGEAEAAQARSLPHVDGPVPARAAAAVEGEFPAASPSTPDGVRPSAERAASAGLHASTSPVSTDASPAEERRRASPPATHPSPLAPAPHQPPAPTTATNMLFGTMVEKLKAGETGAAATTAHFALDPAQASAPAKAVAHAPARAGKATEHAAAETRAAQPDAPAKADELRGTSSAPAPAPTTAATAPAPALDATPLPPPALAALPPEVLLDPSLRVVLMPQVARIAVELGDGDPLRVQVRVKDGVADVQASASASAASQALSRNEGELRVALAKEGLALGHFDLTQSDSRGQRQEAREEYASRAPAQHTAPRSTTTPTSGAPVDTAPGRLHVKA